MNVRVYTSTDHEAWLRLRRKLWPEIAPDTEIADAGGWLARTDAAVLVAEGDGVSGLIGFAEVGARTYADGCDTSPVAYLEGWYVEPELRRTGVGTALLLGVELWARERGYAELASDALLGNEVSQRAHTELGFTEVERSVKYRKLL